MEFIETTFSQSYMRTGTKNLRCFPSCGEHHMEKSFCGRVVKVVIRNKVWKQVLSSKQITIYSDFETYNYPFWKEGTSFKENELINGREVMTSYFSNYNSENEPVFVFHPTRRWKCESASGMTVLSVLLVVDNLIVQIIQSTPFKIKDRVQLRKRSSSSSKNNTSSFSSSSSSLSRKESKEKVSHQALESTRQKNRLQLSEQVMTLKSFRRWNEEGEDDCVVEEEEEESDTMSSNSSTSPPSVPSTPLSFPMILPKELSMPCLCFQGNCTCLKTTTLVDQQELCIENIMLGGT